MASCKDLSQRRARPRAAAEGAAHRQRDQRDVGGLETRPFHQAGLAGERILLAGPDRQLAVLELRRGVDRLHRRVVQERNVIGRLDDAIRRNPLERSLHVAALVDGLAVLAGQRAIVLRPEALRGNRPVAAVREHRREGREAAARRPVALRDHGDRIVQADDALDALDLHRRRGIDGGELAAMDRRGLHRRVEHPGQRTSMPYCIAPVTLAGMSSRGTDRPMIL